MRKNTGFDRFDLAERAEVGKSKKVDRKVEGVSGVERRYFWAESKLGCASYSSFYSGE